MNNTNQMVSVPCELLEQALDAAAAVGMQDVADELGRLLTPTVDQNQVDLLPCPFCGGKADLRCSAGRDPDWFVECTECMASASVFSQDKLEGWNNRTQGLLDRPAEQHQGEPIMLTAVATLVDDGDGGLEPSWLLEGDTAELFAGMLLLVADNAPDLCSEDGSAQVYTRADPGEVERLREALAAQQRIHQRYSDAMCELGELLRNCFIAMLKGGYSKPLRERIKAALECTP